MLIQLHLSSGGQEVLEALNLKEGVVSPGRFWHCEFIAHAIMEATISIVTSTSVSFTIYLSRLVIEDIILLIVSLDFFVSLSVIQFFLLEASISDKVALQQHSRFVEDQADRLLLQALPLENVAILVAHSAVVQVQIPPLAEQESVRFEVDPCMSLMIHRLSQGPLEVIGEEFEGPCVHSGGCGVKSPAHNHFNSLTVLALLPDLQVINPDSVQSLPSSEYQSPLTE